MKIFLFIIVQLFTSIGVYSQQLLGDSIVDDSTRLRKFNDIKIDGGLHTGFTSNGQIPFWMRSNQFGNVPLKGVSVAIYENIYRDYDKGSRRRLVDWGFGLNSRLNLGSKVRLIPIELYLKGRLGIFQLKVGRSKDLSGLVDSTLSTGSFSISGNALGIPKIELSIPEFWNLPLTDGFLAIKGFFSHGWMGDVHIQHGQNKGSSVKTYFHNASFHVRIGKPQWKFNFYSGLNHEVMWGSDKAIFGNQYDLSTIEAFYYVITGKKYANYIVNRDISKIGNHLGSLDAGFQLNLEKVNVFAYRQQFYDKGALYYLANIEDGLSGLSITNKSIKRRNLYWKKVLLEVFYSKGQAGAENAKETPSGPEYYYNHGVYQSGYSYKGLGIGNPLVTAADNARDNLPSDPRNYFINNRVLAFHFGMEGGVNVWSYKMKLTYSKNYGDYSTSGVRYFWANGFRIPHTPIFGIFPVTNQFSGFVEASRTLKRGYAIGFVFASDQGNLLYKSVGGSLKLSKSW